MKKTGTSVAAILLVLNISCSTDSVDPHATNPEQASIQNSDYVPDDYVLSFYDEFTSFDLDTNGDGSSTWAPWFVDWGVRYLEGNENSAWKCDVSFTGGGDSPLGIVLHEHTDSGTLRLKGYQTPDDKLNIVDDFPYIAGMISANKSFAQTYGYWEIKCRFEATKGHHWALWLLPADNSWPPEIDIVEYVGHAPDEFYMTGHWDDGEGHRSNFETFTGEDLSQWHVFGFTWTPDEMTWFLDGKEMKQMANFVDKPMYLLMTPEIGSRWTGPPDETTIWPTVGEIDYVRIYQQTN